MIFQIHKEHGKHIAYDPQEAKRNETNGWKTVTKEEFYGGVPKAERKKPGPKPKTIADGMGGSA